MLRRLLLSLVFLGLPGMCLAQGTTEKYLSPNTQIYLRWDGFDANREAFDKTASGQILKGDTGKFLANLWTYLNEQIDPILERTELEPQYKALIKEVPGVLASLGKHGFVVSIDLQSITPPDVEMTCVFPGSGGPKGNLSNFVNKLLKVTGAPTTEIKVDKMVMHRFSHAPLEWGFGSDGDTAIMVVGTIDPAIVLRRAGAKAGNISKNKVYKELLAFKEFPVSSQGYIDVGGLTKLVAGLSPEASRFIDDLGIKGLKSITINTGYDGLAMRSVTDLHMPGERKGILKLTKSRTFTLKDLPPLPHDVTSFSASSMDAPAMYDFAMHAVESGTRAFAPDAEGVIKFFIQQIDAQLGFEVRNDLLASLGELTVTYNAKSESPLLGLGSVTLIQVKNEKKLKATLEKLFKAVPDVPGLDFEVKKKMYRGAETMEISVAGTAITLTIHKGWLAYANYPQPVHGFILRVTNDFPVWKGDTQNAKAWAAVPKEFVGISYSDPRPNFELLLSIVPPVMSIANTATRQFLPGSRPFDVSSIPHPLEVTRHLFPTISVTSDDGKKLRYDTRSALGF